MVVWERANLKRINRETLRFVFVADLVRLRHDRGGLLGDAALEGVYITDSRIIDHGACGVGPAIGSVERLP